jgi:hypothetical protein
MVVSGSRLGGEKRFQEQVRSGGAPVSFFFGSTIVIDIDTGARNVGTSVRRLFCLLLSSRGRILSEDIMYMSEHVMRVMEPF